MSFEHYFNTSFYLETQKVFMRGMQPDDFERFLPITRSSILWKYFTKELNDDKQLLEWMNDAFRERDNHTRMPFTVADKASNTVCGSTSFGNISFFDRRIEIGWTWLGEQYLGTGINRHCKFALLEYAFEVMGFERVEIKTDNLNERAKQALRKIGAVEEGVLRSHMQMPHNRRRDTVYYSILRHEWNSVRQQFFNDVNLMSG
jgi:RimJ/RimL family protein N-acetyltransferase